MSEVQTFFRFCPSCGKRFHIKLVSKKLVGSQMETFQREQVFGRPMGSGGMMMNPTVLAENIPVTVDVEEFQYSYKCSHCGHSWSEEHSESQKVG